MFECSPAQHPHGYDSRCPRGSISKSSFWGQFLQRRRLCSLPWGTTGIPEEPSRRAKLWSSPDVHFRRSTVSHPIAVCDSPNSMASLDPLPPKKPACLCNSLLPSKSSKGHSVRLLGPAVKGSTYLLPSPLLALGSLAAKSANTELPKSTVIALLLPGARTFLLLVIT